MSGEATEGQAEGGVGNEEDHAQKGGADEEGEGGGGAEVEGVEHSRPEDAEDGDV